MTSKSHNRRKISNSAFWLLMFTGLLPSLVAALINIQSQQLLLARASRNLQASADRLAKLFGEHLEAATAELGTLAAKPLLGNAQVSIEEKLSQLRLMKDDSTTFEELFVLSVDGRVLASTASEPGQLSLQRDWVEQMKDSVANAYGPVKLAKAAPAGLLLTSAIKHKSDAGTPLLVGFTRLDKLTVKIKQFALGHSGLALLANEDEFILAGSIPSLVGQSLSTVLGKPTGNRNSSPGIEMPFETTGGYYTVARTLPYSVFPAGDSWQVLVAQGRTEILGSSHKLATWSLITVIVITPAVLIIGLLFTRSVRRSLDFLITATQKIAKGDFTSGPIDQSYSEIGELVKSFGQMKDSLAKSRQQILQYQMGLEDLVAQRTKEVRESEEKYRTLYESSRDALMLITPEKGFLSGNPAAIKMFGCQDEKEFASKTLGEFSPEYQPDGSLSSEKAQQMIAAAMKEGSHFFEWRCKRMDGTEFFTTFLLATMELNGRKVLQATVRDISERKRLQDMLIERAQMDPLTELGNRRALMARLGQEWSRRQRYGGSLTLIMSDIDHFKPVNDTHGHQVGDEILCRVAKVFLSQCRESDFPTRYGGEEFAIVLPSTDAEQAANLAERCRRGIEDITLDVDGCTVKVTASFGVADASDLPSVDVLIHQADEALFQAKHAGRNRVILACQTPLDPSELCSPTTQV